MVKVEIEDQLDQRSVDPPAVYVWECSVCGASNTGIIGKGEGIDHAINNLMNHIRVNSENGHGSRGAVPDELDTTLTEYVGVIETTQWSEMDQRGPS